MPAVPAHETAVRRCVALLLAGALLPLAGCSSDDGSSGSAGGSDDAVGSTVSDAALDVQDTPRDQVASGGTVRWAVDRIPRTLNAFGQDADAGTDRVAGATLPALFTLDAGARPQLNSDYLESAEVTSREPKQTVVYKLNPKAVWSTGRHLSYADFAAQWKALSGRHRAYGTARNAGYDRIAKVTRGGNAHEVKVVFRKPFADWQSLFTPLYPKSLMGSPSAFKHGARRSLPASAGPFRVRRIHGGDKSVDLVRNARWWGDPAKLRRITLRSVARDERQAALAKGRLDLAEIDTPAASRVSRAHGGAQKGAVQPGHGDGDAKDEGAKGRQGQGHHDGSVRHLSKAARARAAQDAKLRRYTVRKAFAPAYTQLALNGDHGPLADERVRRAVARAIDRRSLTKHALAGTGLPVTPLGSHLRMPGQDGYEDNSGALGDRDVESAQSLLGSAGWKEGGKMRSDSGRTDAKKAGRGPRDDGGQDDKAGHGRSGEHGAEAGGRKNGDTRPGHTSAGAATGSRLSASGREQNVRVKSGKPLTLRFVLPSGPGSRQLRATGERIAGMLNRIGVHTRIDQVSAEDYFSGPMSSGDYDLALYSWPGTAYPASDDGPVFAKPRAAADGSLRAGQNYTRVGTNQIDQLFAQASGELDADNRTDLIKRADARIWAAAGSVPLYQRPELVAARGKLVNAGAFGFQTPRYQDIGYKR